MGPLAFGLCDLAGTGDTGRPTVGNVDPRPADGAGPPARGGADLPHPAEPMLSAVLGVAAMGDEDCLDMMTQATRSIARWQGVLVRAMARFAELRPPEPVDDPDAAYSEFAADELACLLALSPGSAAHRLAAAHTLAARLPATLDALDAGMIDYGRAMAMIEITEPLSAGHARAVEDKVLAGGARPSHGAFRQAARRAALKVDPDSAEQRRKDARADRQVTKRPLDDGAAELGVKLPAELTEAIYDRIDYPQPLRVVRRQSVTLRHGTSRFPPSPPPRPARHTPRPERPGSRRPRRLAAVDLQRPPQPGARHQRAPQTRRRHPRPE
jgi:hypothetical protein